MSAMNTLTRRSDPEVAPALVAILFAILAGFVIIMLVQWTLGGLGDRDGAVYETQSADLTLRHALQTQRLLDAEMQPGQTVVLGTVPPPVKEEQSEEPPPESPQ
jgi:hypothetical protein